MPRSPTLSARRSRTTDRILPAGAVVGTTPIRALLHELPRSADVVTVLRASTAAELALSDEIVEDVAQRGETFEF